jgi:2,5-dichloro-2,5-cyclohexadiene-1,4-diol dehydrogenase 1
MGGLVDKVYIVTGGGSGIGRATAVLLAAAGCKVAVVGRRASACEETIDLITRNGGVGLALAADTSVEEDAERSVQETYRHFGRLDGACNSAGTHGQPASIENLSLEEWRRLIDVNLTSAFLSIKYQAPAIERSGGGSIVMVASTASVIGFANSAHYCASKHGLLGLVRAANLDFGKRGVRINALIPSATRTPMFEMAMAEHDIEEGIMAAHPIGRAAEPDEVARPIRWLLSDESSYMMGSVMTVDGGYTSV